jgi:hypothetical protein
MIVAPGNFPYYYTPAWPPLATGWGPTCSGVAISAQQYQYAGPNGYGYCTYYSGSCEKVPDNEPLCFSSINYLNMALPGVLEVSAIPTSCNQLAASGGTSFVTSIQYINNSRGTNIANGADMVGIDQAPANPNCNWKEYAPTTTGTSLWY